jgi:4-hydroxy-2-oxoheptanedioate aldolase
MTFVNPLLEAWQAGRTTLGAWAIMPGPGAEAMVRPGIDWVIVDLQHGLIGPDHFLTLAPAIAARGAVPLARVAANDATLIGRALDSGGLGVVVPLVDDADGAARAVAACRFAPRGVRSYGPSRFTMQTGSSDPADVERVACIVMIETAEGLRNVKEIAATPGVDAILIGPADLAIGLGVPPASTHDDATVREAVAVIRSEAEAAGIVAGMVCPNGTIARRYVALGFRMVVAAIDLSLLAAGTDAELRNAQGG